MKRSRDRRRRSPLCVGRDPVSHWLSERHLVIVDQIWLSIEPAMLRNKKQRLKIIVRFSMQGLKSLQ